MKNFNYAMKITTGATCAALLSLLCCLPLAAQQQSDVFFVQLADPQFGAFTADLDFVQETANYEFVIENINRLQPAFVVICGDLINKVGDAAQAAEYFRITSNLDASIPLYAVAGNHDVGNAPTPETLADYRKQFGPDYYSFQQAGIYGIVLNSSLISAPAGAQAEADMQEQWLTLELEAAQSSGASQIVVFQHHSWFLEDPQEPDRYFNIPNPQRRRYLDMLKAAGVGFVFAGHYHRNAYGFDGDLQMITTGPVGRPLGDDPSGIRVVKIVENGLDHIYYSLGTIPNRLH